MNLMAVSGSIYSVYLYIYINNNNNNYIVVLEGIKKLFLKNQRPRCDNNIRAFVSIILATRDGSTINNDMIKHYCYYYHFSLSSFSLSRFC